MKFSIFIQTRTGPVLLYQSTFWASLILIGKYHFTQKLHRLTYERYPYCQKVEQNMHVIDLQIILGLSVFVNDVLGTR